METRGEAIIERRIKQCAMLQYGFTSYPLKGKEVARIDESPRSEVEWIT
jgi:hypothetical protein